MCSARNVANFFIDLANRGKYKKKITNMRVNKLLYFAQGHYLAKTETPLFDENFLAWDFGPVVPEIYRKYSVYGERAISLVDDDYDFRHFSSTEIDMLLDVSKEYENYTTSQLVEMTHRDISPWKNAYSSISKEISKDEIKTHFLLIDKIPSINDILSAIPVYDKVGKDGTLLLPADEYCQEDDIYAAELLNAN